VCDFVRPAAPIKSAISGVRVGHLCPHGGVEAVKYWLCNNARRNSVAPIIVAHDSNATGGVMNRLLTVAILLISTVSLFAQGQQPNVAKLKADAQKVVSVISGDKAKTQTYCQIAKISVQVDQAAQEKDRKTAEELVQKINELEKQLGPEYLALVDALFNNNNIDLNSEDFEEIVSMFDRFDEACRQ
jgi:hypothetical protein